MEAQGRMIQDVVRIRDPWFELRGDLKSLGGVKRSGHGREKGFEALYGFASLKTISVYHG